MALNNIGSRLSRFQWQRLFNRTAIGFACALWFAAAVGGYACLLGHDFQPTAISTNLTRVEAAQIPSDLGNAEADVRIFVAIHPKCPCSRVTLTELERTLQFAKESYSVVALVYVPETRIAGTSNNTLQKWLNSESIDLVGRLPNAVLFHDIEGAVASGLELNVSGAIVVVNRSNEVLLRGGITASRSCSIENPGLRTLQDILTGNPVLPTTTPVFGCPIRN